MHHASTAVRSLALSLTLAGLSACSGLGFSLQSSQGGLDQVDQLLTHVERVQVESVVSKERAQGALEGLRALVAPEFKGDAAAAHTQFVSAVEQSMDQAEALQASVRPLKRTGERVFEQWTEDLESFGNIAMRQRSQERLEATRARYEAILTATMAAQLAYDAFNGDLHDHALFLEHDFNATSVGMIAGEQEALRSRAKELARRLDACSAACQAYVEFSAPRSEVTEEAAPAGDATPAQPAPLPSAPKKTTSKPKPRPGSQPQ